MSGELTWQEAALITREVPTSLGPVTFRGRDTGRPVLLVITGLFAETTMLNGLQGSISGLDVWRTHLPGFREPALSTTSVAAFGRAYSEAVAAVAADRQLAVMGLSAGALVALWMDQAPIRRLLLVEPPLRTDLAWPLESLDALKDPAIRPYRDAVLGRQDFRPLLKRLQRPTTVLLGEIPLEPRRDLPTWPSLVDAETRAELAANPLIRVVVAPGAGHNIALENVAAFVRALQETLRGSVDPSGA